MDPVELFKSLGPAGISVGIMYLWVRAERERANQEAQDRKDMTDRALVAVERSAQLAEGTSAQLKEIRDGLREITKNGR